VRPRVCLPELRGLSERAGCGCELPAGGSVRGRVLGGHGNELPRRQPHRGLPFVRRRHQQQHHPRFADTWLLAADPRHFTDFNAIVRQPLRVRLCQRLRLGWDAGGCAGLHLKANVFLSERREAPSCTRPRLEVLRRNCDAWSVDGGLTIIVHPDHPIRPAKPLDNCFRRTFQFDPKCETLCRH
jgi:hypothetical protein